MALQLFGDRPIFGLTSKFVLEQKRMRHLIALAICTFFTLGIFSAEGHDLELDFEFLKPGLERKSVIDLLGPPIIQSKSQSLFVEHRKLTWISPNGTRYTASFVHDRLWRWKKCSTRLKKMPKEKCG